MGRFAPKYPKAAKVALAHYVMTTGCTVRVGRDLLARGELPGWQQPVDMPMQAAYLVVKDARNKRALQAAADLAQQDPQAATRDLWRRATAVAEKELERLERKPDLDQLAKLATVLPKLAAMAKTLAPQIPGPADGQANDQPDAPVSLLERLAARAAEQQPPDPSA